MLAQTPLAKNQWRCPEGNGTPRLSELGINGQQSSRWQLFARVDDELFYAGVNGICERDEEITTKAVATEIKRLLNGGELARVASERALGDMLAQTELNKGGRPQNRSPRDTGFSPRLSELGINKSESSRWQLFARIDDELFYAALDGIGEHGARNRPTSIAGT